MANHGTCKWKGITLHLTEDAYVNSKFLKDCIGERAEISLDPQNFYTAAAVDADENEWVVYWEIINHDAEDESESCNWKNVFYAERLD